MKRRAKARPSGNSKMYVGLLAKGAEGAGDEFAVAVGHVVGGFGAGHVKVFGF